MIITLTTDFGSADYFVAAMKGVILSHDRRIRIVDVTHELPPHRIEAAAFSLLATYAAFPRGTVHVVVVDPGVGSDRRAIVLATADQFFVAPDNGVLDYVLERGPHGQVREIEASTLMAPHPSTTFHGRDVFAPTAARLATGFPFSEVGRMIRDPVRVHSLAVATAEDGRVAGRIIHIDHFGNCVTNLSPADLGAGAEGYRFTTVGREIGEFRTHYRGAQIDVPFVILGSAGFFEISVDRGSAAKALGVEVGSPVTAVPR